MAEPERLEPMEPPFSLLRRQLPSGEAKCGTKMVSIILCAPTVGCVTSLCPPQTPNSSLLTSKAIPHNSKCRYGERGAADAKPKAGCFIEHFGNADAVPQPPERCLSRKAGIVRYCLISKTKENNAFRRHAGILSCCAGLCGCGAAGSSGGQVLHASACCAQRFARCPPAICLV